MITGLISAKKTESLWIGYALASKVLKDDLKWLKRRFAMLEDILRDTPVYQEVLAKGEEKGLEKGQELGFREGQICTTSDTSRYCPRAFSRDCLPRKEAGRYHRRSRSAKTLDCEDKYCENF